jgi:filamin
LLLIWLQIDIHFNKDRNLTYTVSYVPRLEGNHKVSVKFAGREIPKSPYTVSVEGHAGDPSKVTASGPGLQPDGVMIHRPTYFDISTKGMRHLRLLRSAGDSYVCLEGNSKRILEPAL